MPNVRIKGARIKGSGLIEVLAALVIINIVFLTFLFGQKVSEQRSQGVRVQASAASALNTMADAIAMNTTAANANVYAIAFGAPPPASPACDVRPCTALEFARYQLAHWKCRFDKWHDHRVCQSSSDMNVGSAGDDGYIGRRGSDIEIIVRWYIGKEQFSVTTFVSSFGSPFN